MRAAIVAPPATKTVELLTEIRDLLKTEAAPASCPHRHQQHNGRPLC
jgi:hypothetical protein